MQEVTLLESSTTEGAVVDRAAGVIRGVKIVGKVSKWGRTYSDQALQKAVPLYEQAPVYLNHPADGQTRRSVQDKVGWIENVSWRPEGNFGDYRFLESHPATATILEWAEKNPKGIGFSQNARGTESKNKSGVRFVESIVSVRSVDLVDSPATTSGLFESFAEENPKMKSTLRNLIESYGSDSEKEHLALLEGNAVLELEVEVKEPGDDKQFVITEGFSAAAGNLVVENKDNLAESLASLVEAREVLRNGKPDPVDDPPGDDANLLESLKEKVARMETEKKLTALLEQHSVKASDVRLKALSACDNKSEQMELIESWKDSGKPAFSGRMDPVENFEDAKSAFSRHRS